MILINGGKFVMGTDDGMPYESPTHEVTVKSFWMDRHEVTIAEFAKFVTATGYQTDAEKFGWSGAFNLKTKRWENTKGADWRHPDGPGSQAADNEPASQVSWNDAAAYARWAGKTVCRQKPNGNLLRAADWFRRSILGAMTCGQVANRSRTGGKAPFPIAILTKMDLSRARPSRVSRQTDMAFTEMTGNVWEWCADLYGDDYYASSPVSDPRRGRLRATNDRSEAAHGCARKIFWTNYRVAARSHATPDSGLNNLGFRCVRDQ